MSPPTHHQPVASSSSAPHVDIPQHIPGGFTIGQEIGRGSFAVVYQGLNTRTHPPQTVAIKAVIKSKLTNKLFQNLQDEIKILKKIRHGNVVGLVDCTSNHDYIFLIMQYCSQGDLSVYIKSQSKSRRQPSTRSISNHPERTELNIHQNSSPITSSNSNPPFERFPHPPDGGLNEWITRSFLGQLADALRFLRSHSILHRDIKPQNLLLHPSSPPNSQSSNSDSIQLPNDFSSSLDPSRFVPEGIPILRVADFGFARVLAPNAGLAETLCGSPLYMAPEILRYEKYDAKADLWSVGAVLFEMTVGKPPFRAQNHVELLRKIERSEDNISFPEDKVVAQDLKELILSLLKRNPSDRVSFEEFFLMADKVSRIGPLIPPPQPQSTSSTAHSSAPLRPRLMPSHSPPVQEYPSDLSPRPPSTSTFPHPFATTAKPERLIHSSPFDGEPGAFILEKNPMHKGKSALVQPRANKLQANSTSQPSQNRQSSLSGLNPPPGIEPPSPTLLPSPLPSAHRPSPRMPSFPAKYIVPGSSASDPITSNITSTAIKSKDYALVRSPTLTSAFPKQPSSNLGITLTTTKNEEDDDRDLGTEYVVVEKGSVEINAMVDGLASSPHKPMGLSSRMSRGFMGAKPTLTTLSSSPHRTTSSTSPSPLSVVSNQAGNLNNQHSSPVSSFPPRPHPAAASPIPTGTHPMNINNFGRSSPSSGLTHHAVCSSPQSFDSGGGGPISGIGSLPIVGKYFPQSLYYNQNRQHALAPGLPPNTTNSSTGASGSSHHPSQMPTRFPSSTICRAILSSSPSRANQSIITSTNLEYESTDAQKQHHTSLPISSKNHLDPVEVQLLSELEQFACKALVIIQFADEKLNMILPPPPSALSSTGGAIGAAATTSQSFSEATTIGAFVTPPPTKTVAQIPSPMSNCIIGKNQTDQNNNSSGSTSTSFLVNHPTHLKTLFASEALVVYIKALAFLNKAIRHAVAVVNWKRRASVDGVGAINGSLGYSHEIGYAIEWLRHIFNEVFEKAEFVKSKVNSKSLMTGRVSADKLIYDRALEKSRSAAVNELVGEKLEQCEIEYESSLWMLHGLLDRSIIRTETIFEIDSNSGGGRREGGRRKESSSVQQQTEGELDETSFHHHHQFDEDDEMLKDLPDAFIFSSASKIIDSILIRLDALRKKINAHTKTNSNHNTLTAKTRLNSDPHFANEHAFESSRPP